MKESCDNGFGNVLIEPVTVQKRGGLFRPEQKGTRQCRYAICKQDPYRGRVVLYLVRHEQRAEVDGKMLIFVPKDAILGLFEPEETDEIRPVFEVDQLYGNTDAEWIYATGAA